MAGRRERGRGHSAGAGRRSGSGLSRREVLSACLGAGFVASEAIGRDDGTDCVDVDLSAIPRGKSVMVTWQGRRVFVRHRTAEEIRAARVAPADALVDPQPDEARVRRPEWIVVVGECTHAGCKPIQGLGEHGGWLCLCHGSDFDTSGRVRRGPALENLEIPPYTFVGADRLRIGESCATGWSSIR